ncbi:hypothetical protein N7509_002762 [Penicillium cosmopolitanum]|uniref:Glycoside hydrolase subgroup catalytic core protein n=1 Tax=Penicillium cosmopolitanum TaxID=1131564 RepID=A0A9W9W9P1_9EURO|nr:uncharacterized protein N7509_002762 [Penicillium cosmopolitanum]KAJ5408879.1 hypothetical protein N7509_002762 [Penicillium cosmopolitanum]
MFWLLFVLGLATAFNNPPGVSIWCGKAYMPTNKSFAPGGALKQPSASKGPLLNIQVRPRMSLYIPTDVNASFIVESQFSYTHGVVWDYAEAQDDSDLKLEITIEGESLHLHHSLAGSVTSKSLEEVPFSLKNLTPRFIPYSVTLTITRASARWVYNATTQLFYLPPRTDGGSITKVDSLYGGLLVQNYVNGSTAWTPLLPYSYYTTLANAPNPQAFINQGYNIIYLVPDATTLTQTFNLFALNTYLNACDQVGLWVMYDMRYTYQNLVSVTAQVTLIKSRKSLLLWYTGDEPDGHGDPLNGTSIAYSMIKLLDPWHPVSVLLNCYNFYYGNYSAGADIILSDVYPIGVNTTWSVVYNTPCNKTYGRCGCDDCDGVVEDISTRLSRFEKYQTWLGSAPKPLWGVPQAFGNQAFYNRTPTAVEEVTMMMLSLNHNAKGIVMWIWPTTAQISNVTRQLGTILVNNSVTAFLLGARNVKLTAVGQTEMDVAGWRLGRQMLLAPKKDTDGIRGIEDGGGL